MSDLHLSRKLLETFKDLQSFCFWEACFKENLHLFVKLGNILSSASIWTDAFGMKKGKPLKNIDWNGSKNWSSWYSQI